MNYTLKSGREITYEKPTWEDRSKIWDSAMEASAKGIGLSLETCTKALLFCKVCTKQQLNNDEFSIEEVFEITGHLLEEMFTVELNKKK